MKRTKSVDARYEENNDLKKKRYKENNDYQPRWCSFIKIQIDYAWKRIPPATSSVGPDDPHVA